MIPTKLWGACAQASTGGVPHNFRTPTFARRVPHRVFSSISPTTNDINNHECKAFWIAAALALGIQMVVGHHVESNLNEIRCKCKFVGPRKPALRHLVNDLGHTRKPSKRQADKHLRGDRPISSRTTLFFIVFRSNWLKFE